MVTRYADRLIKLLAALVIAGVCLLVARWLFPAIPGSTWELVGNVVLLPFVGAMYLLTLGVALARRPNPVFIVGILFNIGLTMAVFGQIYHQLGILGVNGVVNDWATAAYFSVVTFTTLGYGDLQPVPAARPYAAAEALVGYLYLALFAGFILLALERRLPRGREGARESQTEASRRRRTQPPN